VESESRCGVCGRSVLPAASPSSSRTVATCACGAALVPAPDATIQHAIDRLYLKLKTIKR